ncbi:MAG TPA: hypothetical protein VF515_10290 [Candidatus Binatia bacterium]
MYDWKFGTQAPPSGQEFGVGVPAPGVTGMQPFPALLPLLHVVAEPQPLDCPPMQMTAPIPIGATLALIEVTALNRQVSAPWPCG